MQCPTVKKLSCTVCSELFILAPKCRDSAGSVCSTVQPYTSYTLIVFICDNALRMLEQSNQGQGCGLYTLQGAGCTAALQFTLVLANSTELWGEPEQRFQVTDVMRSKHNLLLFQMHGGLFLSRTFFEAYSLSGLAWLFLSHAFFEPFSLWWLRLIQRRH